MEYTHLGRSGLSVSRLVLGTMNFGPETSEADSHVIMDQALELGINFFDTANVYGWKKARATPRRSSAAGSPRAAGDARRSSSPRSSTGP
jgi:NDP-hexose 2,3-enoyl reductase